MDILEKMDFYLNEVKIEVGKSYRGKDVYPSYNVNNITKDGFVEYTIHTASGSKQGKMKLVMFQRISGLKRIK